MVHFQKKFRQKFYKNTKKKYFLNEKKNTREYVDHVAGNLAAVFCGSRTDRYWSSNDA